MTYKEVLALGDPSGLELGDIKRQLRILADVANKRAARLRTAKATRNPAYRAANAKERFRTRGTSKEELLREYKRATIFLTSPTSTVKGYRAERRRVESEKQLEKEWSARYQDTRDDRWNNYLDLIFEFPDVAPLSPSDDTYAGLLTDTGEDPNAAYNRIRQVLMARQEERRQNYEQIQFHDWDPRGTPESGLRL